MTRYIGLCRVSTGRQGRSGLGLDAQQEIIRRHLRDGDDLILPVMIEVESGRSTDRPVLRQALDRCRITGATLLLAKLDRLSRDRAFTASVLSSGVPVEFCDLPASKGATGAFLLGVMAEVAALEAGLISERTKAALAQSSKRLGGDRGFRLSTDQARLHGASGGAVRQRKAQIAAEAALHMIHDIQLRVQQPSLHRIAAVMNAEGAMTPRGKAWTATAVRRALARVAALVPPSDGSAAHDVR